VTLSLVAGGAYGATTMLSPPAQVGPYAVGQAVHTGVGLVRVTGVERMGGLTAQDLASANHGVANLVSADQAQVQVTLRLTNDTDRTVDYSPSRIGLRINNGTAVTAMSSTLPESRLRAGASLEGTLGFVAARNGATLRLELPTDDGPVLVDLGTTDVSAGQPQHTH
jgi:hypothetical protein